MIELPECPKGAKRQWNEESPDYRTRLHCGYWNVFINPSGHSCALCVRRRWPESENWKRLVGERVALRGRREASDMTLRLLQRGRISEELALEIGEEYQLP